MAKKQPVRSNRQGTAKRPATRQSARASKNSPTWKFPLNATNFKLLGIAGGVIILGYILLSIGITEDAATPDGDWNNFFSVTLAPIVLVIGYCILLPYAILKRSPEEKKAIEDMEASKSEAASPTEPNATEDKEPVETQASH